MRTVGTMGGDLLRRKHLAEIPCMAFFFFWWGVFECVYGCVCVTLKFLYKCTARMRIALLFTQNKHQNEVEELV